MPLIHAEQSVRVLGAASLRHCEKSMTVPIGANGMVVGIGVDRSTVGTRVGSSVGSRVGSCVGSGLGGSVAATGTGSGGNAGTVAVGVFLVCSAGTFFCRSRTDVGSPITGGSVAGGS